jgi:hypothetical protein
VSKIKPHKNTLAFEDTKLSELWCLNGGGRSVSEGKHQTLPFYGIRHYVVGFCVNHS